MKHRNLVIFFGVIITLIYKSYAKSKCITPIGAYKPRNRNDLGRYIIDIPGNPKMYTPNQKYNVSLKLNPLSRSPRSFKNFMITLESEKDDSLVDDTNIIQAVGHFQFGYDMLSTFSSICPNTVIESNALAKTEVQLFWTAPPKNSGCVSIKATVIESRDNWYSEDGPLTKVLCEESTDNENTQPPIIRHCCACNEAKYEIAFEGLWTRNTHPKDFPSDVWSTKFSDVIGASHKIDGSFWKYGDIATDGLRDLSADGNTKTLEQELKEKSDNIRTIIKARGLQYPNITLSTFAVFRVDNQNHLVSVVSKITPSPDWIVGVANLELCRSDCTWEESRVLNLYPWDAGVDDGASYTSRNEFSIPRQPIRRIKSNSPNDPRSPFYDETGEDMKPIARLHLIRQRLYDKVCDASMFTTPAEDDYNSACATTDWDEWSSCSKPCGKGIMFRQRQYLDPENSGDCNRILVDERECMGQSRHCDKRQEDEEEEKEPTDEEEDSPDSSARCELGEWGVWSSCSAVCGTGTRTRDRKYVHSQYANLCGGATLELQENEECEGTGDCEDYEPPLIDDKCDQSSWGRWSLCNVTCGIGFKVRFRIPMTDENDNEVEDDPCGNLPFQETVECYEPACDGIDEKLFGSIIAGNHVSSSPDIISQGADGEVVHCKVSKWSSWDTCQLPDGETCGKGTTTRQRRIKVHALNGGNPCPKKLIKSKKCTVPCPEDSKELQPTWGEPTRAIIPSSSEAEVAQCVMSPWTKWSPCSSNCGGQSFRIRTRYIVHRPEGVTCPVRLQQKRCPLPLACTDAGLAPL